MGARPNGSTELTAIADGAHSLECRRVGVIRESTTGETITVLREVECVAWGGRPMLVHGPSGVGKTTLLSVMSGLTRPTFGELLADKEPVSRWLAPHRDRWRRSVGVVFQEPRLVEGSSVRDNVELPIVPRRSSTRDCRASSAAALEALGIFGMARRPVAQLSGGQRQLVQLARAVVADPTYLLADEPTAHQDSAGTRAVLQVLDRAARRGAVVVVAGHDPRLWEADIFLDRHRLEDGVLKGE